MPKVFRTLSSMSCLPSDSRLLVKGHSFNLTQVRCSDGLGGVAGLRKVVAITIREASEFGVEPIAVREIGSYFRNPTIAHYIPFTATHHQA